jgi:hypothetical protein
MYKYIEVISYCLGLKHPLRSWWLIAHDALEHLVTEGAVVIFDLGGRLIILIGVL